MASNPSKVLRNYLASARPWDLFVTVPASDLRSVLDDYEGLARAHETVLVGDHDD